MLYGTIHIVPDVLRYSMQISSRNLDLYMADPVHHRCDHGLHLCSP